MKRYTSSTAMLGILAALTAGTMLISAKAFADPNGQQPDTKGCCEKGECEKHGNKDAEAAAAAAAKKKADGGKAVIETVPTPQ